MVVWLSCYYFVPVVVLMAYDKMKKYIDKCCKKKVNKKEVKNFNQEEIEKLKKQEIDKVNKDINSNENISKEKKE